QIYIDIFRSSRFELLLIRCFISSTALLPIFSVANFNNSLYSSVLIFLIVFFFSLCLTSFYFCFLFCFFCFVILFFVFMFLILYSYIIIVPISFTFSNL